MPTQQEIEQEKLNPDGSSTDGCLPVLLFLLSLTVAITSIFVSTVKQIT